MTKEERIRTVVEKMYDNRSRVWHFAFEENDTAEADKMIDEMRHLQEILWLFDNEKYLEKMEKIYKVDK